MERTQPHTHTQPNADSLIQTKRISQSQMERATEMEGKISGRVNVCVHYIPSVQHFHLCPPCSFRIHCFVCDCACLCVWKDHIFLHSLAEVVTQQHCIGEMRSALSHRLFLLYCIEEENETQSMNAFIGDLPLSIIVRIGIPNFTISYVLFF